MTREAFIERSNARMAAKKIRKSTIRKFETIVGKLEWLQREIPDTSINHEINQCKSRLLDVLRKMEGGR